LGQKLNNSLILAKKIAAPRGLSCEFGNQIVGKEIMAKEALRGPPSFVFDFSEDFLGGYEPGHLFPASVPPISKCHVA
jgi:hypothetical protein